MWITNLINKMEHIKININKYSNDSKEKKKIPHEKSFIVIEIIKLVGKSDTYNFGYWLSKLKQFEKHGGQLGMIYGWLKDVEKCPSQFNKGGVLTNKFKKWKNETKI